MKVQNSGSGQVKNIREQMVATLDTLLTKGKEFEIDLEPQLELSRRRLLENNYKVLVVGEAKSGKSTFINALIGRDLLPTDVDVATCQVFDVRSREQEAYRLRFEDDSVQSIAAEDLPRYGSQAMAGNGHLFDRDRILRWIEVDVPARFMPEGISILDTPGLGALYAAHAQITQRFIPHADAVIYALDSGRPLAQTDLDFITEILTVTREIFFIQTKIDQYGPKHWQEIQARNQKILQEHFGDSLPDLRVWPVSGVNMLRSVVGDETVDILLDKSRYRELESALHEFLERVVLYGRTAAAASAAEAFHDKARGVLELRRKNVVETKQESNEIRKQAAQRNAQFSAEWSSQGQRHQELMAEIKKSVAVHKASFQQALSHGGDVSLAQEQQIHMIKSSKEAQHLNEVMPNQVAEQAAQRWKQESDRVIAKCTELIQEFAREAEKMDFKLLSDPGRIGTSSALTAELSKSSSYDFFRGGYMGAMPVMMLGRLAFSGAVSTVVAPWIVLPAVVAVAGLLVTKSVMDTRSKQLERIKGELRKNLGNVLNQVKRHFLDVDSASNRHSRVDEFFNELQSNVSEHIQAVVKQKHEEANKEVGRLNEEAMLGDKERADRNKELEQQLAEWKKVGETLGQLVRQLVALSQTQRPLPRVEQTEGSQ